MLFDLVTPEKLLVSEEASYVNVPGSEGAFGVLEGHQPTLSTLTPGMVEVEHDGKTNVYYVGYGFVDVAGDKVTVLAEEAMVKADIDVKETTADLNVTKESLAKATNTAEAEALERKMVCLEARLKVAKN